MIDSSKDSPSRPEDWTLWLKSAALTPFGPVMPDNYDGVLRDFWQRQFGGHLEAILDIGCGNGALCWIADELLNRAAVAALSDRAIRDLAARVEATGCTVTVLEPFVLTPAVPIGTTLVAVRNASRASLASTQS